MNNTSRSGCSLIHKNCLKISNNIKNWMKEIVRNNALLGRASPHDPDTPLLNPGLWAVSWTLSYHCPPSAGC